jgi:hypothetical protein
MSLSRLNQSQAMRKIADKLQNRQMQVKTEVLANG